MKLAIEKFADRGVICLKLSGTIDESFEGKKTARTVDGDTLVLDLGGVNKISSFGIREWVDFVGAAGQRVKQLVLVECAPKVIDQLNMVANFSGGGKVFSFYAPFRCDFCDSDHRVLVETTRDFDAIRAMKLPNRPCPKCTEAMYFDDDAATFFSFVLGQGPVELDANVAAFLAARLDYRVGTLDGKLRVDKAIDGRITYVRLAGALDDTFPRDKLAEGVEGTLIIDLAGVPRVEPAGAAEWRDFVQQVSPVVDQLYFVGVQPAFLEKLCSPADLGAKAQVVDLSLPYACPACGAASTKLIDVAEQHAVLKFATAPEARCPACHAVMQCQASEPAMTMLPSLAKPALAGDVAHELAELRARTFEKKPSAGILPLAKPPEPARTRSYGMPLLLAAIVVVVAAVGFVAYQRLHRRDPGPYGLGPVVTASAQTRPAGLANDLLPGGASCTAINGRVTCTGMSLPLASQQEAEDEASDAAYEALAYNVAGKATALAAVAPGILEQRAQVLAAFARDPMSTQARQELVDGRRAVARVFRRTAPPLAGRYWEAFDLDDGRRFVAFAMVAGLTQPVRRPRSALGAIVVDFPPLLAWRFPKLEHGAVVTKLEHGPLQDLGVSEHDVVLAIDGHEIVDVASFESIANEEYVMLETNGGTLRVLVQPATGEPRELTRAFGGKPADTPAATAPVHSTTPSPPTGGVNVWDRYGGSAQ